MTLREVLDIALAAQREDEAEAEAIIAVLVPWLLDDERLLARAIEAAWPYYADQIREAITQYQVERAEIDAEIATSE